jgi:hypothetical protein
MISLMGKKYKYSMKRKIPILLDGDSLAILERYKARGTAYSFTIRLALKSWEKSRSEHFKTTQNSSGPDAEPTVRYD